MTPQDLRAHKQAPKKLEALPAFKPVKKGALPPPFHKYKSKRIQCTSMLELGGTYAAVFMWRDGPILTDRSFYAYLFQRLTSGRLSPVFEFHWHPSHKGFHCKVPCRTKDDYTDRMLPGAPELAMKTVSHLDPRSDPDRQRLIKTFCDACGIEIPPKDPETLPLFDKP